MKLLTIVAAISMLASAALAKDDFETMGAGSGSCGEFAQRYRQQPGIEMIYFTWAQGFLSATNLARGVSGGDEMNLASMPVDEQKGRIRSYCNQHPLAQYMDAVIELFPSFDTLAKN